MDQMWFFFLNSRNCNSMLLSLGEEVPAISSLQWAPSLHDFQVFVRIGLKSSPCLTNHCLRIPWERGRRNSRAHSMQELGFKQKLPQLYWLAGFRTAKPSSYSRSLFTSVHKPLWLVCINDVSLHWLLCLLGLLKANAEDRLAIGQHWRLPGNCKSWAAKHAETRRNRG